MTVPERATAGEGEVQRALDVLGHVANGLEAAGRPHNAADIRRSLAVLAALPAPAADAETARHFLRQLLALCDPEDADVRSLAYRALGALVPATPGTEPVEPLRGRWVQVTERGSRTWVNDGDPLPPEAAQFADEDRAARLNRAADGSWGGSVPLVVTSAAADAPRPADDEHRDELHEGHIVMEAEKHQPEPGGCTCGFCAYSSEHVAVMVWRDLIEPRVRAALSGEAEKR